MANLISLCFCIFLTFYQLNSVYSCDGFHLTVRRARNCESSNNDVLRISDFNATLTSDCKLLTEGCLETRYEITRSTVHYNITKSMMRPIRGSKDGCSTISTTAQNDEVNALMTLFGVPTSCPMAASRVCGARNKEVDISKYRRKLTMLIGETRARFNIETNAGTACLDFEGNIRNNYSRVCGERNKEVDINKYRRIFTSLIGEIRAIYNIETDAGSACLDFEGTMSNDYISSRSG